jgi:hypothetical protein
VRRPFPRASGGWEADDRGSSSSMSVGVEPRSGEATCRD